MKAAIFLTILTFISTSYSFEVQKGVFTIASDTKCKKDEDCVLECVDGYCTKDILDMQHANKPCPNFHPRFGAISMLTKGECQRAIPKIRIVHSDAKDCVSDQSGSWINRPMGCIFDVRNRCVYWNAAYPGTINVNTVQICSGHLDAKPKADAKAKANAKANAKSKAKPNGKRHQSVVHACAKVQGAKAVYLDGMCKNRALPLPKGKNLIAACILP